MAIASNPGPFAGESPDPDRNRVHRITFCIGSVKTAAHVVRATGSLSRYDRARDDSSDPDNISTPDGDNYITEES